MALRGPPGGEAARAIDEVVPPEDLAAEDGVSGPLSGPDAMGEDCGRDVSFCERRRICLAVIELQY